ncbi:hypothetical protein, partial [Mesorhizobium sp.]|uniref:hypothetical protein n=1 Tax=Mesorhizobium sp. TaxID=1871066 RepID=UPI0025C49BCB
VYASAAAAATAAGSGDAATTTGVTIDRMSFASLPRSALFSTLFDATLASGKTLSIAAYAVQDSADGTNWSDYQTSAAAVVVGTGPSGGGAVKGQFNVQCDLNSARRYVRFNTNQDLNATGTDTSVTRSVAVLGGFDRLPSPN